MSVQETQRLLAELRQLLTTYSVEPWATRIAHIEARFRSAVASDKEWAMRSAFADVARLLHGGPGTLHKVVIRQTLGDAIAESDEAAANARLSGLLAELSRAVDQSTESTLA